MKDLNYVEYLVKVEEYVAKKFNNVIIISQVSITEEKFYSILKNFKKILERYSDYEEKIIKSMWGLAPKTCLYITVAYAIYHYDGNFWGKFKKAISLQNEHIWKKNFLKILIREKMVIFDRTGPQKYINNILGHASLPKHNIRNFITNVIEKAIEYNLEPEEIVAAFKYNSGNVRTYGIYKGVKDFIKLNNHVSNDVLSRCLKVWKEHKTPFYQNYRYYLPDHILEEFDRYVNEQENKIQNLSTFVKRPFLMYSPENQNIFISLPTQRFPINRYNELKWIVRIDNDEEFVIYTDVSKSTELNEIEFSVSNNFKEFKALPNKEYIISLIADGVLKGEWEFSTTNFIIFNGNTLKQDRRETIPSKSLIMVVHEDLIQTVEEGKNACFIKPLFGEWSSYYEVEIFVTESDTLVFPEKTIHLSPERITFELVGKLCPNVKSEVSFFNEIPSILIKNQGNEVELRKWTIHLSHDWTNYSKTYKLEELHDQISISNKNILISLNAFFETMPFGKYTLSLTGNLGQDYKTEFIVVPEEIFNIEIYSMNDKKAIQIRTKNDIEFHSESVMSVQKLEDELWKIHLNPKELRLKGTILNKNTFETVNLTIFTSPVVIEIKHRDYQIFPLGEVFNKMNFQMKTGYVLVDLENPTVFLQHEFVTVYLKEPLRSGEEAQKSFRLKTGRKHLIGLDYFDGIHDTFHTRTLFLEIPEIQYKERLLTLETYWKINNLDLKKHDGKFVLSWDISFPPEELKIRIWLLNKFDAPFLETVVAGTECSIEINELPEGYLLVEMFEYQKNDLFASLFNTDFPSKMTDRMKIFRNFSQSKENYTYTKWLLLEDVKGIEYERDTEEVGVLLKTIFKKQDFLLQLLLEDYDSCCDFGIQHIDKLLDHIKETKDDENEYLQFLYKIIGFQEWDFDSFQNVLRSKLITNDNAKAEKVYVPKDIYLLYNMKERELFLANQRKRINEQLLKGFSLTHAFIRHLYDVQVNASYCEKLNHFLNKYLDDILVLKESLLKRKIIPMQFNFYLNERMIHNDYLKSFPYFIGLSACFTALLLYFESELSSQERIFIRTLSLWMLQEHQEWYLHDLVYWKIKFKEYEIFEKQAKERRKKYGYPSFAWKS